MTADLAVPQATPDVAPPVAQPNSDPATQPAAQSAGRSVSVTGHVHTRSCYWDLRVCGWVCP